MKPANNSILQKSYLLEGKSGFAPSITIAVKKTDESAKQIIQNFRKSISNSPKNRFYELGTLSTKQGSAHLCMIQTKNQWAELQLFQAILIKDGLAYMLTACAKKSEFSKYEKQFLTAFKSFDLK